MKLKSSKLAITVLLSLCLLSLASCGGDDAAPDRTPLLASADGKTWISISWKMNGIDITEDMEECEKDDLLTFYTDGSYSERIGSLACDEFDVDVEGSWSFKANGSILSIRPAGDVVMDLKIVELTEEELEVSQHIDFLQATISITLIPQ